MRYLFTFSLILGCAGIGAKAQTIASKPEEVFKQKPLTMMDSLTWHMPKTTNALTQLQLGGLYGTALANTKTDTLNNIVWAEVSNVSTVTKVYSTMPVIHLSGNDKMPVVKPGTTNDKINRPLVVINPLAEVPKP